MDVETIDYELLLDRVLNRLVTQPETKESVNGILNYLHSTHGYQKDNMNVWAIAILGETNYNYLYWDQQLSIMSLTPRGLVYISGGGVTAKRDLQNKEKMLIDSSIRTNASVKTTNKIQIINIFITLAVFGFTTWVSWQPFNRDSSNDIDKFRFQERLQKIEQNLSRLNKPLQSGKPSCLHPKDSIK